MRYPASLIEDFGTAAIFAEAASAHPLAPKNMDGSRRVLDRDAVYMWKQRNTVPYMWRPVVSALQSKEAAE